MFEKMHLSPSLRAFMASMPMSLALVGGCYSGLQPTPEPAAIPGEAPLRRLTNGELINTLSDLFPSLHPALPELPADALVSGFDNDAHAQAPSDVRVARYETIAGRYAEAATQTPERLRALVGCANWSTPSLADQCAEGYLKAVGARLFRRPLSTEEYDRFALRFGTWRTAVDFEAAVRLTLSAWLQSPQFLYRPEPIAAGASPGTLVAVSPYAMASRLSYFLWESTPDQLLLDAAAQGQLASQPQVHAQAKRMLQDPRAKRVYWSFYRQWMGLGRMTLDEHAVRVPEVDAQWTRVSQTSALEESRLFVEHVAFEGGGLSELLTSRRSWLNAEMARIYHVQTALNGDPNATWFERALPAKERAGLLTRAAFLVGYSHRGGTSPPVRGNGIQLNLLCALPLSPPPGVDLSIPMAPANEGPKTTRTLFEQRTQAPSCIGCHQSLNGFGFGLEHYNAAGIFRETEQGLPIDAKGELVGTDVDGPYQGTVELSRALAKSRAVHACASQRWVRYALGREPSKSETPLLNTLTEQSLSAQNSLQAMLANLASSTSFRMVLVPRAQGNTP